MVSLDLWYYSFSITIQFRIRDNMHQCLPDQVEAADFERISAIGDYNDQNKTYGHNPPDPKTTATVPHATPRPTAGNSALQKKRLPGQIVNALRCAIATAFHVVIMLPNPNHAETWSTRALWEPNEMGLVLF